MSRLGLDLGGSSVKAVVLSGDHDVVARATLPLPYSRSPGDVVAAIGELARSLASEYGPVDGVGLALPGHFDESLGTPLLLPNLPPSWLGFPARDRLSCLLGQSVVLINDARAFALAESTVGAARGLSTVVCVVLGTGVGGGIVVDGRLLHQGRGTAGEIGHQTIDPEGPRCGCGNRGCVESLISAAAVARRAGQETVEDVYELAKRGDPRARQAVRHTVAVLGLAMANAYALLAPDAFVVGGGVAGAGEFLLAPLAEQVREHIHLAPPERIRVLPAVLGRHAGAIGAALRVKRR